MGREDPPGVREGVQVQRRYVERAWRELARLSYEVERVERGVREV